MATKEETRLKIARFVRNQNQFRIGNISGKWLDTSYLSNMYHFGIMPHDAKNQLIADIARRKAVYVVYSYETPIAWFHVRNEPKWTIPEVKYSITTIHHQNLIRVITETELYG